MSTKWNKPYKKCVECGNMKLVGIQCIDPETRQCDKNPKYIKTKRR